MTRRIEPVVPVPRCRCVYCRDHHGFGLRLISCLRVVYPSPARMPLARLAAQYETDLHALGVASVAEVLAP